MFLHLLAKLHKKLMFSKLKIYIQFVLKVGNLHQKMRVLHLQKQTIIPREANA